MSVVCDDGRFIFPKECDSVACSWAKPKNALLLLKEVALPHPAQELGSRKHLNAVQQSGMTVEPSIFITHQQVIYFRLRIECLYQRALSHLSGAPQEYAIFLCINYFL